MPRILSDGRVVGGGDGYVTLNTLNADGSVTCETLLNGYWGPCILDATSFATQAMADNNTYRYDLTTRTLAPLCAGSNGLVSGEDGRYLASIAKCVVGTIPVTDPSWPAGGYGAGLVCGSDCGAVAVVALSLNPTPILLIAPDGTITTVPGPAMGVSIVSPTELLMTGGGGPIGPPVTSTGRTFNTLPHCQGPNLVTVGGVTYLVYYSPDCWKVCIQRADAPAGDIYGAWLTSGFNQDWRVVNAGATLRTSYATGAGERPGQIQIYDVDLTALTTNLTQTNVPPQPVIPSIPAITHPCTITPFAQVGQPSTPGSIGVRTLVSGEQVWVASSAPLCWPSTGLAGVFSEAADITADLALAVAHNTRLMWLHDGTATMPIPAALRPSCDVLGLECYLAAGETLAQSVARWTANLTALLLLWPGQVALIAQGYTMLGAWTEEQVLDCQPSYSNLANTDPRIIAVCHFCFGRADAILSLPTVLARFVAASPGPAVLNPVNPQPAASTLARYLALGVV